MVQNKTTWDINSSNAFDDSILANSTKDPQRENTSGPNVIDVFIDTGATKSVIGMVRDCVKNGRQTKQTDTGGSRWKKIGI